MKIKKKIGRWFIQTDEGELVKDSEANTAAQAWARFCYPALNMLAYKQAGYRAVQIVPKHPCCEWALWKVDGVEYCHRLATHLAKATLQHNGIKVCKSHIADFRKVYTEAVVSTLELASSPN